MFMSCRCVQDLLTRLSASLSLIEQYAVRHLESLRPVDVEAAAAAAVEDIRKEEWELDAIERRKEQQVGSFKNSFTGRCCHLDCLSQAVAAACWQLTCDRLVLFASLLDAYSISDCVMLIFWWP